MGLSAKEIARQAAEWSARVHAGDMSADESARLDAWLAADPRHLGAYGRVEAALARLDRLSSVGAASLRRANDNPVPARPARRLFLAGGVAASIAALFGVGTTVWKSPSAPAASAPDVYATRVGETRTVTLADGSIATLNTDSRIAVRYSAGRRAIQLERGEALFKVAKNKQRPFVVTAADTSVRAVGTAFSVRLLPRHPVQILVQEGVVEVTRAAAPSAPVRAVARTQTVVPTDAPIVVSPVSAPDVVRDLAWQHGQIVFANETLGEAAAEFARYNDVKIVVDPAIAGKTVTGMFASNDPVGFAKSAALVNNLHVEVGTQEVWIIR
jgi:transmembrane sensor